MKTRINVVRSGVRGIDPVRVKVLCWPHMLIELMNAENHVVGSLMDRDVTIGFTGEPVPDNAATLTLSDGTVIGIASVLADVARTAVY